MTVLFAGLDRIVADVAQFPAAVRSEPQASQVGGGGVITSDQFAALNICEAGGENGWRTGRYGLELGYPIGDWSIEQQQAKAQEIYDRAGAHAWGPLCAPILGG